MKNALLFISTILSLSTYAQNPPATDPDFINRPYYVKEDKLIDFERTDATLNANIINGNLTWSVFNNTSSVSLKYGTLPMILIKVEGGIDPVEVIALIKAEVKKDRRIISTGKKLGGKAKNVNSSEVKITFKKIRTGIYQIVIEGDLPKGEYVFVPIQEANAVNILSPAKIKMSCFVVE